MMSNSKQMENIFVLQCYFTTPGGEVERNGADFVTVDELNYVKV